MNDATAALYFPDNFGNLVTTASAAELIATLPPEDCEDFLQERRDWNTQDDWYDGVYEQFIEEMDSIGISISKMHFSGFWSQGDGACFDGRVSNWPLVLAALAEADKDLKCFVDIYDDSIDIAFGCMHSGRYYHSRSVSYTLVFDVSNSWDIESFHLRYYFYQALIDECNLYLDDLQNALEVMFTEHMDDLYKNLEQEYDYLTSDEYIMEMIEVCEVEELIQQMEDE